MEKFDDAKKESTISENAKSLRGLEEFPRWMEKFDDATKESTISENAKSLRSQGFPCDEWLEMIVRGDLGDKSKKEEDVVFICNGIQTNFVNGWGSFVRNSQIIRQAYAIRNLPFSSCTALVIEPKHSRGIRRLCVDTKTNKCKIEKAICGCVLLKDGVDVSRKIETSLGVTSRVDAVLWDPRTTRAAFSAVGFTKSRNEIVFVAVTDSISVTELAKWMRDRIGIVDAVLCGGSADVQQIVKQQRTILHTWGNIGWNNMDCGAYGDLSLAIENEEIVRFEDMAKDLENLRNEDIDKSITKVWPSYVHLTQRIKDMQIDLDLVRDLHHHAIQERHWRDISNLTGSSNVDVTSPRCRLRDVFSMGLHIFDKDIKAIVNLARAEHHVGSSLDEIERHWDKEKVSIKILADANGISDTDRILQVTDDHQMELQRLLMTGRSVDIFRDRVTRWRDRLTKIETVIRVWISVQSDWSEIEHIFKIGSTNEIRTLVPHALEAFSGADTEWKSFMKSIVSSSGLVSEICCDEGRHEALLKMQRDLEISRRALDDFFRSKRELYPRLFFLSDAQLCDIFSAGQMDAPRIARHIPSIHRGISELEFDPLSQRRSKDDSKLLPPNEILAYIGTAPYFERIPLEKAFKAVGQPEDWLQNLELSVKRTLRNTVVKAYETSTMWSSGEVKREEWILSTCAQVAILVMRLRFVEDMESKMDAMDSGDEDALRSYLESCRERLVKIVDLYRGKKDEDEEKKTKENEESTELTVERRGLVGDAIVLDLRIRDIVEKLINRKCKGTQDFMWESQLRMYFQPETFGVTGRVCAFEHSYFYDPLDRLKRLVVTPLTERCFVSMTCALQANSGVSIIGASSSGKTDTLTCLARHFGMSVYTFDCTNTMTCRDMGIAISGLAQLGSWGLFRHLDQLSVNVLSVAASQLRSVFDAIRRNLVPENREEEFQVAPEGRPGVPVARFSFPGHDICSSQTIQLVPTVNVFATMNLNENRSRISLPENLKIMFRPCSIMCPDVDIICEYLLKSSGFENAKRLASKISFVFKNSSELVSRRAHYNWSVRGVVRLVEKICELQHRETSETKQNENELVLRALATFRDASMQDCDTSEFDRLVGDMFGGIKSSSTKELRDMASTCLAESNLQQDEEFLNKVCSLSELLRAQHAVIVLGPPASGKTEIWRCLARCHKEKCVVETISPKTMSHEDLYGKTCERSGKWKDGAISNVLRNMSNRTNGYDAKQTQKWVVLDGNLDESWMSAMYSATGQDAELRLLESNERVSITESMKIIFETDTLTHASPAIVSRSGVLYINEGDVGYEPFVASWCARRGAFGKLVESHFKKYVEPTLKLCSEFKTVIPVQSLNIVETVCAVLDAFSCSSSRELFVPYHMQWRKDTRPSTAQTFEATKAMRMDVNSLSEDSIETLFLFALFWGFGSAFVDRNDSGNITTRETFSIAFLEHFPESSSWLSQENTSVFDYFLLPTPCGKSVRVQRWNDFVPSYDAIEHGSPHDTSRPFASIVIPTEQSCRTVWFMQLLEHARRPTLVVGSTGSQKTSLTKELMNRLLSRGNVIGQTVTMSRNMAASSLQVDMERHLIRHSGDNYGAPSSKRIHVFVDDMHKPASDEYGIQSATELLRHFFDYQGWRDRENPERHKTVSDFGIVATGNPVVSAFLLNARLHHHFSVVAVSVPRTQDLETIYGQILGTYFSAFPENIQKACKSALATSFELFRNVRRSFRATPACCHYRFGMHEISELMQGLCRADTTSCTTPFKLMRLWFHEACRVFRDRMVSEYDAKRMTNLTVETVKKYFSSIDEDKFRVEPLLFDIKATSSCDTELKSYHTLRDRLTRELEEYNSKHGIMNLVLSD
eukprot:g6012.t1